MRIASVAVLAALIAAPAYAENANSTASRSVQIVTVEPSAERPAIVYLPSSGAHAAPGSAPIKFERVDEAARARAHAKYEAEKRRWGSTALAPNTRLNEHPLLVESRPSMQSRAELSWTQTGESPKSTHEARTSVLERTRADVSWRGQPAEASRSAEEARAAVLERTARLNAHAGSNDPIASRDSAIADLTDLAKAREILSELR